MPYGVADAVLEKQLKPLPAPTTAPATASPVKDEPKEFLLDDATPYLGTFYSEELAVTYQITEKNNRLYCSIKNKKPFLLKAKARDVFTFDDTEYQFVRDSKNQITEFRVKAGRVTNLKFARKKDGA